MTEQYQHEEEPDINSVDHPSNYSRDRINNMQRQKRLEKMQGNKQIALLSKVPSASQVTSQTQSLNHIPSSESESDHYSD